MRSKRRVFMDACLTAIAIGFVWQILEMIFYGKVQPRIVDDAVWLILWRYIHLAERRKAELYGDMEKTTKKRVGTGWRRVDR